MQKSTDDNGELSPFIQVKNEQMKDTDCELDGSMTTKRRKNMITKGLKRLNSSDHYDSETKHSGLQNIYSIKGSTSKPSSSRFMIIKEESRQSTTSFGAKPDNMLSENDEDLDDFLKVEHEAHLEVLKDDAFNFEDIAFDTVIGISQNDDNSINQRARLNLLNVMNNRKADQKSDYFSLERS